MAEKTIVPGLGDDVLSNPSNARSSFSEQESVNRKFSNTGDSTYVEGFGESNEMRSVENNHHTINKPLLGFLYSISRTSMGEFWPLYQGPNTIGRSSDSDIILNEGTVSSEHACITIYKEDDPDEIYAAVENVRSTNGTRLNGVSIKLNKVECKNMDIIKFGKNYECLFLLVDVVSAGLKQAEDFIAIEANVRKKKQPTRIIRDDRMDPDRHIPADASFWRPAFSDRIRNAESERTRINGVEDTDATKTRTR